MPYSRGDTSTFFLVLRRLRKTLITLVIIFAVAVLGFTLVPGQVGENGEATRMGFFHAIYFISYTATTIGFGEIPHTFSEPQRLWATVCIYLSVMAWAVFVASLLQLSQDTNLRTAIEVNGFRRRVRRLAEPFYLICGYGETGHRVADTLDSLGYRLVVLDVAKDPLTEIELGAYSADVLYLASDTSNPQTLNMAGLAHTHCRGVLALTNDDQANLAIAIAAHLLAPSKPVLARARTAETAANMASFGTRHVIQAVRRFGSHLSLAMHSPAAYNLLLWLTAQPGTHIERHREPPRGNWILCGFGNFGQNLTASITDEGLPITVIDLRPEDEFRTHGPGVRWIQGDGTGAETLTRAGVGNAAGIIAATASDIDNLSIAVTARQLNKEIFVILRQNSVTNRSLTESFDADITMVPSEIVAQECLAILTTPMLTPFLDKVFVAEDAWCESLLEELTERFGWDAPKVWSIRFNLSEAPALYRRLMDGEEIRQGQLLMNPTRRDIPLECKVLQLERDSDEDALLPDGAVVCRPGDKLLLVGTERAQRDLQFNLGNDHALEYVLTGRDLPGGWIWEKIAAHRGEKAQGTG